MYQLDIQPEKVRETLKQHIQADGYDLVLDMEKSQGVYLFDSAHDRKILDFFTCFASMPVGYNHPGMVKDEAFRSEERRVGKECVSTCRSMGSRYHKKK